MCVPCALAKAGVRRGREPGQPAAATRSLRGASNAEAAERAGRGGAAQAADEARRAGEPRMAATCPTGRAGVGLARQRPWDIRPA